MLICAQSKAVREFLSSCSVSLKGIDDAQTDTALEPEVAAIEAKISAGVVLFDALEKVRIYARLGVPRSIV